MHSKLLAVAALAGFLIYAPAASAAPCCDQHQAQHACCADHTAPCCDMPCCANHETASVEPSAIEIFFAMNDQVVADPQVAPAAPVRQVIEVWFNRPTRVGKSILQGRYVIEHDNDRMARGEPCTHIYAFNDQKTPVVAFHCTHLDRDRAGNNVAVYYTDADGLARLTEYQFAGETAAHGVPAIVR